MTVTVLPFIKVVHIDRASSHQMQSLATTISLSASQSQTSHLARFWELRGRRTFQSHGITWGHYKGPFYTSLPFQISVDLEHEEAREILLRNHVGALSFATERSGGLQSGLYFCRPSEYTLQTVSRKQRGHVKEGLETCNMRVLPADELLIKGFELNQQTLERQGRSDKTFQIASEWAKFVRAVGECPGMTVWGAFIGDRLATYIIGCRDGDWLHLMYKMSRTADLVHYPSHALDYWIVSEVAKNAGVSFVGNGNVAVIADEGLDRYKRQMGYEILPRNIALHFHPLLAPLRTRTSVSIARRLAARFPQREDIVYGSRIMEGALMSAIDNAVTGPATDSCQQEEAPRFSRLTRPGWLFPALRMGQTLQSGGARYMLRRGIDYVGRRMGKKPVVVPRPPMPDEVLNLQPGEWVQVKTEAEIRATLDARGKTRGLLFTGDMTEYAGKRFRVFKRVENLFLEESKQHRKLKNTVILESSYCHGRTFNCDRSCFLFWKEAWLRRAEPGEIDAVPKPASDLVQIGSR